MICFKIHIHDNGQYLTLSMVSKTSAAAPLAPNIEPKCGAAFPIEKEPIITQKNTCKISLIFKKGFFTGQTSYYLKSVFVKFSSFPKPPFLQQIC